MPRTALPVLPERERGGECTPLESRMTPVRAAEVADLLKVLSDPTRLRIVVALRDMGESVCACDCTASFALSQPTVSHHLARLREGGLLDVTRKSGWAYYSLRSDLPAATKRLIAAL